MSTTTTTALLEQLSWRYAVKAFDATKKIPAEVWQALERALVLAPSSFGLQPWKFLVITDPAVRARLSPASWNQPQIKDASHLVVFAAKREVSAGDIEKYVKKIAQVRSVSEESLAEYKGMMLGALVPPAPGRDIHAWTARQCYIALGVFLTSAAMLGVDACPMEGFDPGQYDQILGLSREGYGAVVIAAAGYRSSADNYAALKKVRYDASELVRNI